MKIYSTWTDELKAFKRFFAGHDVELLPEDYSSLKVDLLLFPGGDDVHPKHYHSKIPENSNYKHWINEDRDEWEFKVVRDFLNGSFPGSKALGICRGMQFLNVALSGTLTYDIKTRYGREHPSYHPIVWTEKTPFNDIAMVNSIHHQAISSIGDDLRFTILAVEPSIRIVESILWGNNILGMQFHPELWGNIATMRTISRGILNWLEGKSEIVTSVESVSSYYMHRKAPKATDFIQLNQNNWPQVVENDDSEEDDEDEE